MIISILDRPRIARFTYAFVPFGWALVTANLMAEIAVNPTLRRAVFSLWLMIVLATPALGLATIFDLRRAPEGAYDWWRRLWTFGGAAYAIHFYFAHTFFEWQFGDVIRHQGWVVAGSNFNSGSTFPSAMALSAAGTIGPRSRCAHGS